MKVRFAINVPRWVDGIISRPIVWYRRRKYGYAFRRIYLGEGKWAIVDEKDYEQYGNFEWFGKNSRGHTYAVRFVSSGKGTRTISLHREIMEAPAGLLVDHKNGNSQDDRRANLRLATRFQNGCNSRIDKTNASSRFRGVRYRKKARRWVANIRQKGRKKWLGSFDSEIAAARAYDAAAKEYHGEFAKLNFPEGGGV